eukprot:203207-Chlamydomonas_euryale.AAC.7
MAHCRRRAARQPVLEAPAPDAPPVTLHEHAPRGGVAVSEQLCIFCLYEADHVSPMHVWKRDCMREAMLKGGRIVLRAAALAQAFSCAVCTMLIKPVGMHERFAPFAVSVTHEDTCTRGRREAGSPPHADQGHRCRV